MNNLIAQINHSSTDSSAQFETVFSYCQQTAYTTDRLTLFVALTDRWCRRGPPPRSL